MPTIRIKRTSEYNNRIRDYKIFIDGKEVGKMHNVKSRTSCQTTQRKLTQMK